jgi:hypothetical protein
MSGLTIRMQAVYINSNTGNDNNHGTEKAIFSTNMAAEIFFGQEALIISFLMLYSCVIVILKK